MFYAHGMCVFTCAREYGCEGCIHAAAVQEDALLLAQDVADLHQTFVDIAVLVNDQSKALEQVQVQVEETHEHVKAGNKQLVEVRRARARAPPGCVVVLTCGRRAGNEIAEQGAQDALLHPVICYYRCCPCVRRDERRG